MIRLRVRAKGEATNTATFVYAIDTAPVIRYFEDQGLDTSLLKKCNSQEFCRMGKVGEGYFLVRKSDFMRSGVLSNQPVVEVVFESKSELYPSRSSITKVLFILDYISIDVPGLDALCIVHTAELKHYWSVYNLSRGYAMFGVKNNERTDLSNTTYSVQDVLDGIIADLSLSNLTYDLGEITEPPVELRNVDLAGYSLLDGLDYVLGSLGWVYEFEVTTNIINSVNYVDDFSATIVCYDQVSSLSLPTPVSDSNKTVLTQKYQKMSIVFPHTNFDIPYQLDENNNRSGMITNFFYPFLWYNPDLTTAPSYTDMKNYLVTRFEMLALNFHQNYTVVPYFDNQFNVRIWLQCLLKDNGNGCFTLYKNENYPYNKGPKDFVRPHWGYFGTTGTIYGRNSSTIFRGSMSELTIKDTTDASSNNLLYDEPIASSTVITSTFNLEVLPMASGTTCLAIRDANSGKLINVHPIRGVVGISQGISARSGTTFGSGYIYVIKDGGYVLDENGDAILFSVKNPFSTTIPSDTICTAIHEYGKNHFVITSVDCDDVGGATTDFGTPPGAEP